MKFSRWTGVVRKWLRLKPPVWETPQWDEMSWEEDGPVEEAQEINIVLSCIYVACFLGSLLWVVNRACKLLGLLNLIMLACILAAMFLMD